MNAKHRKALGLVAEEASELSAAAARLLIRPETTKLWDDVHRQIADVREAILELERVT